LCQNVLVPELQYITDRDWGLIDTFQTCRRVVAADYPSTFVLRKKWVERVLKWALGLPGVIPPP
jgi:hypothetical protein